MKHITPIPELSSDAIARFWAKGNQQPNGCIIWTGKIGAGGYGATSFNKKHITVHRLAYTLAVGEIPAGLVIDHLCRTRACINPSHLEPVLQAENVHRGDRMGPYTTECKNGHPLSGENLRKQGNRYTCRTCNNAYMRAYMREYSRSKASASTSQNNN